jgi:hypothetical protein
VELVDKRERYRNDQVSAGDVQELRVHGRGPVALGGRRFALNQAING